MSEYAGDGMLLGLRGGCTTQHIFYYQVPGSGTQVLLLYKYVLVRTCRTSSTSSSTSTTSQEISVRGMVVRAASA